MKRLLTITTITLLLLACKKEVSTSSTIPKGNLILHLHSNIGEKEIDSLNEDLKTPEGRNISISMAQFYISDIQLVKLDGSIYNLPFNGSLKRFDEESINISDINVGNYKSVRFKVGLIPAINKLFPTAEGYNILLNQSEMWFGNMAKSDEYVFLNFAGQIDTTKAMNGVKVPFEYRIGGNDNLISVDMPEQNITILEGQIGYAHMVIDYSKFFENIDLTNTENLKVQSLEDNKKTIVSTLKTNIASMFRYENE